MIGVVPEGLLTLRPFQRVRGMGLLQSVKSVELERRCWTGLVFKDFFKAAGENLATVEKLTKSFHAVYMILFLSLFYL